MDEQLALIRKVRVIQNLLFDLENKGRCTDNKALQEMCKDSLVPINDWLDIAVEEYIGDKNA
jgi:hypothetical protein